MYTVYYHASDQLSHMYNDLMHELQFFGSCVRGVFLCRLSFGHLNVLVVTKMYKLRCCL